MTSTIQFSGLASGLDTASIISQLMAVEAAPQNALKTRVATQQSQVTALQQANTAFAALATAAKSFATGSTWTKLTATSSSPDVSVTATSTAVPTQVAVTVDARATSAQGYLTGSTAAGQTLTLRKADGSAMQVEDSSGTLVDLTVDSGDGSPAALAAAINATTKQSGLRATVINADGGSVLMVTAVATGAASDFSITDSGGAAVVSGTGGADAAIKVNGQVVTSSSNTFADVLPGVTLTLAGTAVAGSTATVSVSDDGSSRANAMNLFVGQINSLLDSIKTQTAYGTITAGQAPTGGGVLPGDPDLRELADRLTNTIFPSGTTSLATYGLSVDRDGRLTFDQAAFTAAYTADPDAVQAAFVGPDGFSSRVATVATSASDSYDGTLTQTIKGRNDEIDRYNDQIAAWDERLSMKQASLEKTYSNLETMLSRLQSQQAWLSSQIDSLDSLSRPNNK